MTLSANDLRVLQSVCFICRYFDGYAPHGSADWTGVRRLLKAGLITSLGFGICEDCDCKERHETLMFAVAPQTKKLAEVLRALTV